LPVFPGRRQQQRVRAVRGLLARVQPADGAAPQQQLHRPAVLGDVRQPVRVAGVAAHNAAAADGDGVAAEPRVVASAAAAAAVLQRHGGAQRLGGAGGAAGARAAAAQLQLAAVHPPGGRARRAQARLHARHARIIQAGQ
jgi:hypothetical protein